MSKQFSFPNQNLNLLMCSDTAKQFSGSFFLKMFPSGICVKSQYWASIFLSLLECTRVSIKEKATQCIGCYLAWLAYMSAGPYKSNSPNNFGWSKDFYNFFSWIFLLLPSMIHIEGIGIVNRLLIFQQDISMIQRDILFRNTVQVNRISFDSSLNLAHVYCK